MIVNEIVDFLFQETNSNNSLQGYRMNLQFGNKVGYILKCTCMSIYWGKMQLLHYFMANPVLDD